MAYVITSSCIGHKYAECVDVCPVDCIELGDDMYFINPNKCIECGACESVCPVQAIYLDDEVPEEEHDYEKLNKAFFK